MVGELSDRKYVKLTAICVGLYAAFQFGSLFISGVILMAMGCNVGACGIAAILVSTNLAPIGMLAVIVALAVIGIRRSRSLSLPLVYGLLAPLLLLSDSKSHTLFGMFGGDYLAGSSTFRAPTMTLAALAVLVALALIPKEGAGPAALRIPASLVWVVPTLAGIAIFFSLLISLLRAHQTLSNPQLATIGLLILSLFLSIYFARTRRNSVSTRSVSTNYFGGLVVEFFRGVRWLPLAGIAFAMSCVAVTLTQGAGWILVNLMSHVIPTMAIIMAPLVFFNVLFEKRSLPALLLVAISLVPFLQWHLDRGHHLEMVEQSIAEARSIPTVVPDRIPNAVLVEANGYGTAGLRNRPEVRYIFSQDGGQSHKLGKPIYLVIDKQSDARDWRNAPVAELPEEYFEFKSQQDSQYRDKGVTEYGPFELVHVGPEGRSLVALQYRAKYMGPVSAPVFSMGTIFGLQPGWVRHDDGKMTSDNIAKNMVAFIDEAFDSFEKPQLDR